MRTGAHGNVPVGTVFEVTEEDGAQAFSWGQGCRLPKRVSENDSMALSESTFTRLLFPFLTSQHGGRKWGDVAPNKLQIDTRSEFNSRTYFE